LQQEQHVVRKISHRHRFTLTTLTLSLIQTLTLTLTLAGASSGIGRAVAQKLTNEGAKVIVKGKTRGQDKPKDNTTEEQDKDNKTQHKVNFAQTLTLTQNPNPQNR
jgi:hypothetical protein